MVRWGRQETGECGTQLSIVWPLYRTSGPGSAVGVATALRAGRSGDRIPVGTRFSAPVQTGNGAHPASCTMGTGSFPGVKSGHGVTLTPHPLLVPWSWRGRAIPLLPLWTVRPVQSLSASTGVHLTFTFTFYRTRHICHYKGSNYETAWACHMAGWNSYT